MAQNDAKKPKKGEGKTWHNHYVHVGFIRGKGALNGVRLVLTVDQAEKLRKALRDCAKLAQKHERKRIELAARFGKQTKGGFKLEVRLHMPDEND